MSKHHRLPRFSTKALVVSILAFAGVSAFAADFPTGTYSIDASKPKLAFDGKGQFRVVQGDKLMVSGAYTVNGDQIKLTDAKGPWACTKEGEQSGTYGWKFEKSVLTFSKVSDACQDRVGSLAMLKWIKQP